MPICCSGAALRPDRSYRPSSSSSAILGTLRATMDFHSDLTDLLSECGRCGVE